VKESLTKSGPLEDNSSDEEVDRHGRISVPFEESHQEAKTDKHHHVNILKHFLLKKIMKMNHFLTPGGNKRTLLQGF